MAVTIRGIGTFGANITTTSASPAPTITAGTAAGELMVAACDWSGSTVTLSTPPAGWTALPGTITQTNDNLAVYYRYFQNGDAAPAFALSAACTCAAACITFSGAAPSGAPVQANVLGGTASTTVTYPAVTPANATDLLVYIAGLRPTTASTQVTLSTLPAGGTGGTVTNQGTTCTNVSGSAESSVTVLSQALSAATTIAQETSTASTTISGAVVALCIAASAAGVTAQAGFAAAAGTAQAALGAGASPVAPVAVTPALTWSVTSLVTMPLSASPQPVTAAAAVSSVKVMTPASPVPMFRASYY